MQRFVRWLVLASFALVVLPAVGFAADEKKDLYDCGKPNCSEWKEKGENTCRTCETTQCRREGKQKEKELIVGSKKQNQCYEGHGDPPSDEELNQ